MIRLNLLADRFHPSVIHDGKPITYWPADGFVFSLVVKTTPTRLMPQSWFTYRKVGRRVEIENGAA